MIKSFGVDKKDVAKWAGLTGAIFSVSQSITAVPWGKASDRIGRKPIILIGLVSTMICFMAWGMSTSLPMAITVRAIMGGGNGNGMLVLHSLSGLFLTGRSRHHPNHGGGNGTRKGAPAKSLLHHAPGVVARVRVWPGLWGLLCPSCRALPGPLWEYRILQEVSLCPAQLDGLFCLFHLLHDWPVVLGGKHPTPDDRKHTAYTTRKHSTASVTAPTGASLWARSSSGPLAAPPPKSTATADSLLSTTRRRPPS